MDGSPVVDAPGQVEYKVVETSRVTEAVLTSILNQEAKLGWIFDGFQFAMREASHRPSMAFAVFRRYGRCDGSSSSA